MSPLHAQIGGISGSKLISCCVDVVEKHQLEFEPSFYNIRSKWQWNNDGQLVKLYSTTDSISVSSGMSFRFTYGIVKGLEAGVSVPVSLENASWGMRYVIKQWDKLGLAVMAGINTPFETAIKSNEVHNITNTAQLGLGAAGSYSFSPSFSMDINAQYGRYLKEVEGATDQFVMAGADAGYYIFDGKLQLVGAISYQENFIGKETQELVTLYPGITVETGRDFILVLHYATDLWGRNIVKQNLFHIAFTITIR